jgi:hypothetical protein
MGTHGRHPVPRWLTGLFAVIALAALVACSRVSLVYNTADLFVENYAEDYLSLDPAQIARWRPALDSALARHRRQELPYLARFFDDAHRGATQGFDEARMQCLLDQFEELYRRHLRIAVDLSTPLLSGLQPAQIRALEKKFAEEEAEETREDAQSVARRNRKRAERYQESLAWWIGPLSKRQKAIIRETTAAFPDTADDWLRYRGTKRTMLIRLLDEGGGEERIRRFLDNWLVEHRDLPPSLQKARVQIRRQIAALFVRTDETLSRSQRAHFAGRLENLRNDFMGLQSRPRMAPVKCSR